jgi:hypothetical protein
MNTAPATRPPAPDESLDDADLDGWVEIVHPGDDGNVDLQPAPPAAPGPPPFDRGAAYGAIAGVELGA